jgi:hypothetical protein
LRISCERPECRNPSRYSRLGFAQRKMADGERLYARWPAKDLQSGTKPHGGNQGKPILWAAKPACMQPQPRILNEIPCFAAMTVVAPGVRFKALAIFLTPRLSFAIDFNNFKSSLVQRRITFLFFLANFGSLMFVNRASSTQIHFSNAPYVVRFTRIFHEIPRGIICNMISMPLAANTARTSQT